MTKDENASKPSRGRNRGQNKEKIKPPTKVVIRHLPPTMTEEEFLRHFEPLPKHDFYYFAAADWSLGFGATCRAYITLKNYDDVFLLRDQFDGYVFVDTKGAEYSAIVEFAPFQGLVKNKSRRSDKVNTIEEEPHYQNFLKKLEEDREATAKGGECKLEFTLDRKKEEITSTPLLQYLANKKEKRREEKRRQREEEKERRQQNQQHITKIYSGAQDNNVSGKKASKDKNNSNKAQSSEQQKENKSSRSKRRAERNQRRRELYEQLTKERKQQRDAGVLETEKDKVNTVDKDNDINVQQSTSESNNVNEVAVLLPDNDDEAQPKIQNQPQKSRKESKRYSEKRERNNTNISENRESNKPIATTTSMSTVKNKQRSDKTEDTVNESVMNFILSAANFKEFIPKHLQEDQDENLAQETSGDHKSMAEKRIRNKDRPSIAIYEPKARLRHSEESDTNTSNSKEQTNALSRPSSSQADPDSQKTDQKPKKVTRYSKRREKRLTKPDDDEVHTIRYWLAFDSDESCIYE